MFIAGVAKTDCVRQLNQAAYYCWETISHINIVGKMF